MNLKDKIIRFIECIPNILYIGMFVVLFYSLFNSIVIPSHFDMDNDIKIEKNPVRMKCI